MTMSAFIVSDNPATTAKLQASLTSCEIECPLTSVVSCDLAERVVPQHAPDIIFVVMFPNFERTLLLLDQLRKHTQSKLVAVAAAREPDKILQVVHVGPDDYLDEEGDLEKQIQEALSRFKTTGQGGYGGCGQLLTVMSPSGGAGCSMIAANIATAKALSHETSCLFDLDIRRGDLASMFNLKPQYTIIDLCRNLQKLDQQMFDKSLLKHESGVHLLAAPSSLDDVQQVNSDAVEHIVQFARSGFPCVVVDLEDFFHREQFRVLQLSDIVLFVFRLDFSSLRNARRTLDYLDKVGIDRDKFQLVANQQGRPKELAVEQAEDALGTKISHLIPEDAKTVIMALNHGAPAVLEYPRSKLSKAIKNMAAATVESAVV